MQRLQTLRVDEVKDKKEHLNPNISECTLQQLEHRLKYNDVSGLVSLTHPTVLVTYLQWCARSGLMLQHLGHL